MSKLETYVDLKPTTAIVAVRPYVWLKQIPKEKNFPTLKNFSDLLESMVKYPSNASAHRTCADAYFRGELNTVSDFNIFEDKYIFED